ncbi:MAG TPA: hypothetical protein VLJ10_05885, partial [Candidatus Bathyarchaeia archaeon]|nr:hypothetical protein [Candidatus Bathyarchaeia archaeon]
MIRLLVERNNAQANSTGGFGVPQAADSAMLGIEGPRDFHMGFRPQILQARKSILKYPNPRNPALGLDEYDRKHYRWDEETGYWRRKEKELKALVLGTVEDIKHSSRPCAPRTAMRNHVAIRTRNGYTIYVFDDHADSKKYLLEAKERDEIPRNGNSQIWIDDHPDTQDIGDPNAGIAKDIAGQGWLADHWWVYFNVFQERREEVILGSNPILDRLGVRNNQCHAARYLELKNRPRNTRVIFNIDTDAGGGRRVLRFLRKIIIADRLSPATIHISTSSPNCTAAEAHDPYHVIDGLGYPEGFGSIQRCRMLAGYLPFYFLNRRVDEQCDSAMLGFLNVRKPTGRGDDGESGIREEGADLIKGMEVFDYKKYEEWKAGQRVWRMLKQDMVRASLYWPEDIGMYLARLIERTKPRTLTMVLIGGVYECCIWDLAEICIRKVLGKYNTPLHLVLIEQALSVWPEWKREDYPGIKNHAQSRQMFKDRIITMVGNKLVIDKTSGLEVTRHASHPGAPWNFAISFYRSPESFFLDFLFERKFVVNRDLRPDGFRPLAGNFEQDIIKVQTDSGGGAVRRFNIYPHHIDLFHNGEEFLFGPWLSRPASYHRRGWGSDFAMLASSYHFPKWLQAKMRTKLRRALGKEEAAFILEQGGPAFIGTRMDAPASLRKKLGLTEVNGGLMICAAAIRPMAEVLQKQVPRYQQMSLRWVERELVRTFIYHLRREQKMESCRLDMAPLQESLLAVFHETPENCPRFLRFIAAIGRQYGFDQKNIHAVLRAFVGHFITEAVLFGNLSRVIYDPSGDVSKERRIPPEIVAAEVTFVRQSGMLTHEEVRILNRFVTAKGAVKEKVKAKALFIYDYLSPAKLRRLIEIAREEDGRDLGSEYLYGPKERVRILIRAKEKGILAGVEVARKVFEVYDPDIRVKIFAKDGDELEKGTPIMMVSGLARHVFPARRVALNFMMRMSGVATLAAEFVEQTEGTDTEVLDTRKTTPVWRELEKYAVRVGGARNHRFSL